MRPVITISASPSIASGRKPIQNFAHQMLVRGIGAVRRAHHERPSRLIAGKTKRTATDAVTKAARPRLASATTSRSVPAIGLPSSSGSTEKL
jgi:hypothetical protein